MGITQVNIVEKSVEEFRKEIGKLESNTIYKIKKRNKTFAYFLPKEENADMEDLFESFFISLYGIEEYYSFEKDKIQLLKDFYPFKNSEENDDIGVYKMSMFELMQFGIFLKSISNVATEMDKFFKLIPLIINLKKNEDFISKYKNTIDVSDLESKIKKSKDLIDEYKTLIKVFIDVFQNNIGDFAINTINNQQENSKNV